MRYYTILSIFAAVSKVSAFPKYGKDALDARADWEPQPWVKPGPNDARGPCPGLNTLANHGYLPHNGKDITLDKLATAMLEGYNIERSDAVLLFTQAVRTNPSYPLARTFDLKNLGREGVLEHDYSLSRTDRFFGDPLPFNETVWAETSSFFTTPMITVEQLAKARMARLKNSEETNPEHKNSMLADGFSWGECASFFEIMADGTSGTVDKKFIDYWIRNERMPTEIGWKRRSTTMRGEERRAFSRMLMEVAGASRSNF